MSNFSRRNGKGRADGSEIPNEVISIAQPMLGEDPSVAQHEGIVCSGSNCPRLGKWIHGVRYKCSVCEQQDFCNSCVGQPDNGHDDSHPLYECIGPSEFIEAQVLTTGELVFPSPPPDGLPELLGRNNLCLNVESEDYAEPALPVLPLRHIPRTYCGLSLGNVEHFQEAGLLARVILGHITKYDYSNCQLRDFPGHRPAVARLLELKPGNPGDKIECRFRLTRLEDELPYDVLCCRWRDLALKSKLDDVASLLLSDRNHAVYVGDKYFLEASTAVFEALQAIRDPTDTKLVWVDELCIDLAHEKRFQNRSRSLIMRSASKVIVWAGEVYQGCDDAFSLMAMVAHHCNGTKASLPIPNHVDQGCDLPTLDSDEWQSLFRFFVRAVVKTQWELEDISFGEKTVLQCGEYKFDWWDVVGMLKMLAQDEWNEYLMD